MPIFLERSDIYNIIERELPGDDTYPHSGSASAFFSTSDSDATAGILADYYALQDVTYQNQYPNTVTESGIAAMSIRTFGYLLSGTLAQQQQQILNKMRNKPAPINWQLLMIVVSYVPVGTYVQVASFNDCGSLGTWELGVSLLGTQTYLGYQYTFANSGVAGQDWCSYVANAGWRLGENNLGVDTYLALNYLQIIEPQIDAYGYAVRIFGYTLSAAAYAALDQALSYAEPARSFHVISQNQSLSAYGLNTIVNNVNQASDVDCIEVDPTSTTGYTGRTT